MLGLFKKQQSVPHLMRDILFGELPASDQKPQTIAELQKIIGTEGLESRTYVAAWDELRKAGHAPDAQQEKIILGVVVEVGLPGGLDILAAYADHSVRYYNHAGGGVIWEHNDTRLDATLDKLLGLAADLVKHIGPGLKPPAIRKNYVRLNFLTPSGIHYGEGKINIIATDSIAGPVFATATELLTALNDVAISQQ